MGDSGESPYDVAYTDLQSLYMLNTKIERAEAAVDSYLSVARDCERCFAVHLFPGSLTENAADCAHLFEGYLTEMERYRVSLNRLKRRLHSTLDLVRSIVAAFKYPS